MSLSLEGKNKDRYNRTDFIQISVTVIKGERHERNSREYNQAEGDGWSLGK